MRPDPHVVAAVTLSRPCCGRVLGPLLYIVDRAEVRDAAAGWTARVNTGTARTDPVDVDALLIQPDGCVAQGLPTGRNRDATTLVSAMGTWFGQPV